MELLLGVIRHFKAEKEAEGYDWESVKTKYEYITELFVKGYRKESSERFPKTNPEKDFTKSRLQTNVEAIRLKYRKAVDSGKQSGGGRVVATFYDSCQNIWGGSSAAEMIDNVIETSDILPQNPVIDNLDEDYLTREETKLKTKDKGPLRGRSNWLINDHPQSLKKKKAG